ncbi:MAG TPA: GNAT family N-acetyltransferase [Thermodesulfobacteriota bacterium]|nr:GNAT family N-acetyltransferase [Thermodesulfobacteriota bacterium]
MSPSDKTRYWKVRDGDEKDVEEIFSLRRDAFGEAEKDKLDPRFWRWEFMEGPDGKALIYVVEEEDKVIGHFADLPRRFSLHGKEVRGTLSVDLMVHPDYRRRGIFEAMGRYAIQRVRNENGLFMMSFPIRRETVQGFKKIGWEEVVELPVLVYPIKLSGVVNRYLHFLPVSFLVGGVVRCFYFLLYGRKKIKGVEGIEIEEAGLFDQQFDAFWQKASSLHPFMGVRNQNYLSWRYFRHPTRNYTILRAKKSGEMKGYIVLRKVELLNFNSAVIVDLLALDEATLTALVEKGIQHSRQEGADLLGFMVPKIHLYYKILRDMGFLPSFKKFLLMIYSNEKEKGLFDLREWYVNWGDTDVI